MQVEVRNIFAVRGLKRKLLILFQLRFIVYGTVLCNEGPSIFPQVILGAVHVPCDQMG